MFSIAQSPETRTATSQSDTPLPPTSFLYDLGDRLRDNLKLILLAYGLPAVITETNGYLDTLLYLQLQADRLQHRMVKPEELNNFTQDLDETVKESIAAIEQLGQMYNNTRRTSYLDPWR